MHFADSQLLFWPCAGDFSATVPGFADIVPSRSSKLPLDFSQQCGAAGFSGKKVGIVSISRECIRDTYRRKVLRPSAHIGQQNIPDARTSKPKLRFSEVAQINTWPESNFSGFGSMQRCSILYRIMKDGSVIRGISDPQPPRTTVEIIHP